MSGGTLEELMRSRRSMPDNLSRDLFCGDTLAIGGAVNAAVRFLGLAMWATAAWRGRVSQTMQHKAKHRRRTFLIPERGLFFLA